MDFDIGSQVTLVVTSCGRFDLLKLTLASFDRYNTAPVRHIIITEDSGDEAVRQCIPAHWRDHTTFLINNPRKGQLASIDAAYALIETDWIFHCEDDWEFYRPGFVEQSIKLLESDPQALQVWLRSYYHDLRMHSPYVFLKERQVLDGIAFHELGSSKADWQGFSFNPGIRRRADYLQHAPYTGHAAGEKDLSRLYAAAHRYALIFEHDAVLHTGFDNHVTVPKERQDKIRRRKRERLRLIGVLVAGVLLGLAVGLIQL